jgi:hypothetical protein
MLALHIEAATFHELVAKAASALGAAVEAPTPAQPAKAAETKPNDEPELPLDAAPAVEAPKRRGRQPKPSPAEGAPQGDSSDSQPAVEINTGNVQSDAPSDGGVVDDVAVSQGQQHTAPTAAASSVSKDQMREVLNKVVDKFTTAEKGNMPGLEKVSKLIAGFGYTRVKDVREEHFAAIAAAAEAELQAAA